MLQRVRIARLFVCIPRLFDLLAGGSVQAVGCSGQFEGVWERRVGLSYLVLLSSLFNG